MGWLRTYVTCVKGAGWDAWWTWISCPSKTTPGSSHDPSNATPRSSLQREAKTTSYWSVPPSPSWTHWQETSKSPSLGSARSPTQTWFSRAGAGRSKAYPAGITSVELGIVNEELGIDP